MKGFVVSILFSALIACNWVQPQADAIAAAESLSTKDRVDIFETVWKTINEDYYDPKFNGSDWAAVGDRYHPRVEAAKDDAEFYMVINQMLLELQDLHTSFGMVPRVGVEPTRPHGQRILSPFRGCLQHSTTCYQVVFTDVSAVKAADV